MFVKSQHFELIKKATNDSDWRQNQRDHTATGQTKC